MKRQPPSLLQTMPIAPRSRGAWNRIALDVAGFEVLTLIYVTLHDVRGRKLGDVFLDGPPSAANGRGVCQLTWFVPAEAIEARLMAFSADARDLLATAALRPLSLVAHIRRTLASTAFRAQTPQQPYTDWMAISDRWPMDGAKPPSPSLSYVVFTRQEHSEALAATLASLRTLQNDPAHVVLAATAGSATMQQAVEGLAGHYIGILQAGEVLPPHAGQLAAEPRAGWC